MSKYEVSRSFTYGCSPVGPAEPESPLAQPAPRSEVTAASSPEDGRQEDADVADVDGDVEQVQDVVDESRGQHQSGVDGAAHDPTQRVPGALVEPVEEVVEAMLHHVRRGPVVEPVGSHI